VIAFGHLALLRPWWLLALPVVGLLYAVSKPRGGALAGWEKAADPHLLAAMVARGAAVGGRFRTPAILVTLLLGVLALAGPAVQRRDQDRLRNLDATILVVDVSQDMTSGGAIREAASAAHDVSTHVTARQTALIVYAGDAYTASAFTDFPGAIDADLFSLDDATVPDPGVRPDRALALAQKMFEEAQIINGDVVLITSGGGLEGTAATRQARALSAAGHRLYTMDVATAAVTGGRRAEALAALARAGGGFSVSLAQPQALLDTLANEAINRTGNSAVNALDWRDLGRILLALAALPLLLGFRKEVTA
jgi:Ca-activated chloride channel family protein